MAISTYLTVSVIFFYVGLVPDLAAARDRLQHTGQQSIRARGSTAGWRWAGTAAADQWRHYGRAYLFFAALATPLVVSVHSVVSWDFAVSILPGWHSTIFAPYFVAGAIHSGLAMVLTLLIPLRRLLHLENIIQPKHFDDVALMMIVTTLIVGYSYVIELFMAWYSGDIFEQQFAEWRLTGSDLVVLPAVVICNVLLPLLFVFKRVRSNLTLLFLISLFVNIGMWSERVWIVITSTAHDFLPHNWGWYSPTWVEIVILDGSICLLFLGFLLLTKYFPAAPISDIKTDIEEERSKKEYAHQPYVKPSELPTGVVGVYPQAAELLDAVDKMRDHASHGLDTYTPLRVDQLGLCWAEPASPVRYWTLVGALSGVRRRFCPGHRHGPRQQPDRRRQASDLHHPLLHPRLRRRDPAGGPGEPGRHADSHAAARLEDAAGLRLAVQPGQVRRCSSPPRPSGSRRSARSWSPRTRNEPMSSNDARPRCSGRPLVPVILRGSWSWRCWDGSPWPSGATESVPGPSCSRISSS